MSDIPLSGECPAEGSRPKKKLKRRAPVWEHFDETPDGLRAICKYCSKSLSGKSTGGTSHLKRHIENCEKHLTEGVIVNQPLTLDNRDEVRNIGTTQDEPFDVAKKAILAEIPFASSDYKKFWYRRSMVPADVEKEICTDVEKEICTYYEYEKEKLANEFNTLTSRFSFTFDIIEGGYFSLTAHFINAEFDLVKKIICFKKLPDPSSTSSIIDVLETCLSEWKVGGKIFTFTAKEGICLDVLKGLKEKFIPKMLPEGCHIRVPCCKETLKELYSETMDYLYGGTAVAEFAGIAVREFAEVLTRIPGKINIFNEIAEGRGLSPVGEGWFKDHAECDHFPLLDPCSITRRLKHMFIYRDVFDEYDYFTHGYEETEHPSLLGINSYHFNWKKLQMILKHSELFNCILDGLSNFKCPTSHLYLRNLFEIAQKSYTSPCIIFEELLDECKEIFIVAGVLDPRYKLCFFEYSFKTIISENLFLKHAYSQEEMIKNSIKYREILQKFFSGYATKDANHISASLAGKDTLTHRFSLYKREISDLDEYLGEKVIDVGDEDFDLLGWWKQNQSRFPVLSRMARDVLAVPATVYNVKDTMRSDLKALEGVDPWLLEAVICSKDWILGSKQCDVSEPRN